MEMLGGRLGVWLGVLALKTAVGIYLVGHAELAGMDFNLIQAGFLTIAATDGALTFLMVGLLVQADSPAASDAGWMTRPISGARLFVAKVITIVLALILPAVLLALPWWWYCGLRGDALLVAAAELATLQVLIVAPVMAVASVTRTLAQLVVWSVVVIAGMVVAIGLVRGAAVGFRFVVLVVLLLALIAVVLPWHYERRRGKKTAVIFASGVVVSVFVANTSRWVVGSTFVQMRGTAREPEVSGLPTVKVEWAAEVDRWTQRAREPDAVQIRYHIEGLLPEHFVEFGDGWHEWSGDGRKHRSPLSGISNRWVAQQVVLGKSKDEPTHARVRQIGLKAVVLMGSGRVRQLQQQKESYRGLLEFSVVRSRITAEVPLAQGEWRSGDGRGMRILNIEKKGRERLVEVLEAEPFSVWSEIRRAFKSPSGRSAAGFVYVLHNAAKLVSEAHGGQAGAGFVLNGVEVRPRRLMFAATWAGRDAPADWSEREPFRVAVTDVEVVEKVVREVRVPRFEIAK